MSYTNCVRKPETLTRILQRRDKIVDENWWVNRYEEGEHFATESEVREYLALCQELGESFTTDYYMAVLSLVGYPLASVHYVADLLEKAGWTPAGVDQRRLYAPEKYLTEVDASELEPVNNLAAAVSTEARLDLMKRYTERHEKVAAYFGGFLKDAPRITAASALLERLLWHWKEVELSQRWSCRELSVRREFSKTARIHWLRRRELSERSEMLDQQAEHHREMVKRTASRLSEGLYYCYSDYNRAQDADGMAVPVNLLFALKDEIDAAAMKDMAVVKDMTDELMAYVGWMQCELTRALEPKKLERAMELHQYVTTMLLLQIPERDGCDLEGMKENYPEVPEDLYPYCLSGKCYAKETCRISVVRAAQRQKIREAEGLVV